MEHPWTRDQKVKIPPILYHRHQHLIHREFGEVTKNGFTRVVSFTEVPAKLLIAYQKYRCTLSAQAGALFLSKYRRNLGEPLSVSAWSKVVERIASRAELPPQPPRRRGGPFCNALGSRLASVRRRTVDIESCSKGFAVQDAPFTTSDISLNCHSVASLSPLDLSPVHISVETCEQPAKTGLELAFRVSGAEVRDKL